MQLAMSLLVAVYMLLIGGTFDAGLRYRVQLLNTILAALLALTWLVVRSSQRKAIAYTGLEWPLGLFVAGQWLALATSAQARLGLEWVASVTAWAAVFLILCDTLGSGWRRDYVVNALVVLSCIVTAQGLTEVAAWYSGWLGRGLWPPFTFRLNGLLGHANLTATVLNALFPLVLVRALRATRTGGRLGLGLLAAGMLMALFFTSSRAGWLAAGVGLATLAALVVLRLDGKSSLTSLRARWHALSAGARWLLALTGLGLLIIGGGLLAAQSQHITHGPLFSSRQVFWMVAWRMFQIQPLTGAGPDLFPWFYSRWVASPPEWFAPHAHSLLMQVLGGSGLVGLGALLGFGAAGTWQLWRRWLVVEDRLLMAALLAGLASFGFQHLFDYLLGTTLTVFIVVVLLALALSMAAPQPRRQGFSPLVIAPAIIGSLAVAVFALRGAALNERGLTLAAKGDWRAAAQSFEQAAKIDPALTLYWQQAAYAYTRAGDEDSARPLWQRAVQDDPYWSVLPATVGVLTHNKRDLETAQALAGDRSHLYALNAGLLAEDADDLSAARLAYTQALNLRPASAAALFWQQTPLRQSLLSDWRAPRETDTSPLTRGQQALAADEAQQAIAHFVKALEANPAESTAYVGLARAYQALGDEARAEQYRQAGLRVPVTNPEQTLALGILTGDWALTRGDQAAAAEAYSQVFSIVNDYTAFGPGTYGYPQRSWYVFRRPALPSDLIPQFARADISAEMDERFAWLAEWMAGQGQPDTACFIAARVRREAPVSESGAYWEENCR